MASGITSRAICWKASVLREASSRHQAPAVLPVIVLMFFTCVWLAELLSVFIYKVLFPRLFISSTCLAWLMIIMIRAAVILWILSAVVCVGRGSHYFCHVQNTTVERFLNQSAMAILTNNEFAFCLYRELSGLSDSQSKNVFFSPISVFVALATLSVGARGETHQQIFHVLGLNNSQMSQTSVEEAMCDIVNSKQAREVISAGTAVFVDDLFKPRPEFLDVLKQFRMANCFSVDFTKALDAANTINKYVSDKSNGTIHKVVDSLDPSTVMFLLSYVYYKEKWAIGFDPALTKLDGFNVDGNTKVPVQMMKTEHFYTFDEEINTLVLHLPFNNSFSMLLLLPDYMTTLENVISPTHVTKWLNETGSKACGIYIPKFSIKTSYTLNDVLKKMGMTDMFVHANLTGISELQNLTVSEVVHRAALDVDEEGATAASGNAVFDSACLKPDLKFNSPFMLMIVERSTETILFIGKIANPNL